MPQEFPRAAGRGREKNAWTFVLSVMSFQSKPGKHLEKDIRVDSLLVWTSLNSGMEGNTDIVQI